MSSENVKKRSLKMYNFGNGLIIGILENISAFNSVGMPGNFNDVTVMNKSVNYASNAARTSNCVSELLRTLNGLL